MTWYTRYIQFPVDCVVVGIYLIDGIFRYLT